MSTTIRVETEDNPCTLSIDESHEYSDHEFRTHSFSSSTHFVPARSERVLHISGTQDLTIRELPAGTTGLNQFDAVVEAASTIEPAKE